MKAEKRFRELKIERKAIDENSTGFYVTTPAADKAYRVLIKPTDGVTHSA
jgi:hypothetical protein